jgi:hypothetical protein
MSQPDLLRTIQNIEGQLANKKMTEETFLKHLVAKLIIIREVIKRIQKRIDQCQRELEEARQRQDRDRVPGNGGPDDRDKINPPLVPPIGQPDRSGDDIEALLAENARLKVENTTLNEMVLEANNRLGQLIMDLNKYMGDADNVTRQIQELLGIKGEKRTMSEEDINDIYGKFLDEKPGMDDVQLGPYYEENIGMGPNNGIPLVVGSPPINQAASKPQNIVVVKESGNIKQMSDGTYHIKMTKKLNPVFLEISNEQYNVFFKMIDIKNNPIIFKSTSNLDEEVEYSRLENRKNVWTFYSGKKKPFAHRGGNSTRKKHRKPKSNRKTKHRRRH